MMMSNPVFEKHRKEGLISALFVHECSLIREACSAEVARSPDRSIGSIKAKYAEEEERALAWCAWLLNQLEREYGGGLSHRPLDEPEGQCAPRSRQLWASKLGSDRMKSDPLWEMLISFVVGFIVGQLAGATEMPPERDEFERELRKRLRMADEEAAKEGVQRVKSSVARAPSPQGRQR